MDYGWKKEGDYLISLTILIPPASASITKLVECGCKKNKCCSICSCRLQLRNCSEMCPCDADEDGCENVSHDQNPLGSRMKKRRIIHHSENCEITTCSVANIVSCKNSDNAKRL